MQHLVTIPKRATLKRRGRPLQREPHLMVAVTTIPPFKLNPIPIALTSQGNVGYGETNESNKTNRHTKNHDLTVANLFF